MDNAAATALRGVLEGWRGRQIETILDCLNGDDPGEITRALGALTQVINSTGWSDGESIFDLDIPWGSDQ